MVAQLNYTVFQKLRTHGLGSEQAPNNQAIVQIKPQGVRILALDENLNRVLALDDIQFTKTLATSEQISQFQHFIAESLLSELQISKIWFCYSSPFFTLLPEDLFHKEKMELALHQVCDLPPSFIVQNEPLHIEAQIVYGLPKAWKDWTNLVFDTQEVCWVCNEAGFIESGLHLSMHSESKICMAVIENDYLFFGVFSENKPVFFNRFSYKTENDLLYFCLLGMQETGLEPQSTRFIVCGSLLPGSIGMEKLSRYFGEIEFARSVSDIHSESQFDLLRHHNYFDLISQVSHIQSL